MKILRIIASMDPVSGGPCQGIRNSIPELEKLGVTNEVLSLDSPSAAFLGKDSFVIHPVGPGKSSWCYSPRMKQWLTKNIGRFDAIIIHGLWLYHGYAVRSVIEKLTRQQAKGVENREILPKIFVMPHGMLDPYFQKAQGRKLKAIRNWIYWKFIESRLINKANALLFTCEEELKVARIPFSPYHPIREINIGYGILEPPPYDHTMTNAFDLSCPGLNGASYLLFLSRIHEKKGVDLLIKAYEMIITKSSSEKLLNFPKLVIAGPGLQTTYGRNIKETVSKNKNLANNIFFTGMLAGKAKWGAFYGCEAFVLPSHQENFGIAVAEALACGKPVLISDRVNIWREIKNAQSGLIGNDSLEGTRELLEKWIDLSAAERQLFSLKGRELFKRSFSAEQSSKNLLITINNS